jgi:hypothetical protein
MRERRRQALARPGWIRDIVFEGSRRAHQVATGTMERVRAAMKVSYK